MGKLKWIEDTYSSNGFQDEIVGQVEEGLDSGYVQVKDQIIVQLVVDLRYECRCGYLGAEHLRRPEQTV